MSVDRNLRQELFIKKKDERMKQSRHRTFSFFIRNVTSSMYS